MNLRFCLAISILFIFSFKVVAQELPFVHFTPDNELNPLPSAMVTNVFQDSEGFMWMAVHSSGLIRFDGTKMDLYGQKEGVKDLGVWQIVEDKLGYLWVTSNSGLVVSEEPVSNYKNGRRLTFTSEFGGKSLYSEIVNLNQIAVDSSGIVWVGTVAKGFLKYHINEKNNLYFWIAFTYNSCFCTRKTRRSASKSNTKRTKKITKRHSQYDIGYQ